MFKTVPGTAEPNVRVRVGRRIVEVRRERAGIRAIVPVAAAYRGADAVRAASLPRKDADNLTNFHGRGNL
ncbi:MAG: hypothetical protein WDZ40_00655 [Candidatus Spechtbacterales bacterium]